MRALLIIAATLAIGAAVIVGCGKAEPTWIEVERAAREARIAAALEPLDLVLAVCWRIFALVLVIVGSTLAARAVWVALTPRERARLPRTGGMPPHERTRFLGRRSRSDSAIREVRDRAWTVPSVVSPRSFRDPEAVWIVTLFLAGYDIPDIVASIYGVTAGREYQEKLAFVERILRDALKGTHER